MSSSARSDSCIRTRSRARNVHPRASTDTWPRAGLGMVGYEISFSASVIVWSFCCEDVDTTEMLLRGSEPQSVGEWAVAFLHVLAERAGVRAAMPQRPATLP